MKTIVFIIQKEFRQIFRNKGMLPLLFVMPFIQLLVLSNAASFEIKNIRIGFTDKNHSVTSRSIIQKFEATPTFQTAGFYTSDEEANQAMEAGKTDVILEFPPQFEKDLTTQNTASVFVTVNAIDGAAAGIQNVYVGQVLAGYNKNIRSQMQTNTADFSPKAIETIPAFWYNGNLNYKTYMVPGILVLLVTMLTLFLSGMNIVREKELGTLEQINVTPVRKYQFIVGKLFPFWILGLVVLTVGLLIAKFVFAVPMLGNLVIIYVFTGLYLLVTLGIGLFISNFTDTQQQSMFIAWFLMVVFILMSGLFTPIESMPGWAQKITLVNPVRYFVEVIRMVLLKGSGFYEVRFNLMIIALYAFSINGLAVLSYKKVN